MENTHFRTRKIVPRRSGFLFLDLMFTALKFRWQVVGIASSISQEIFLIQCSNPHTLSYDIQFLHYRFPLQITV